jgi:hypothetical protein
MYSPQVQDAIGGPDFTSIPCRRGYAQLAMPHVFTSIYWAYYENLAHNTSGSKLTMMLSKKSIAIGDKLGFPVDNKVISAWKDE